MAKIKYVRAEELFELSDAIFTAGQSVRITVIGSSMFPTLRSCIDSVELLPSVVSSVNKGDVVLIKRQNGDYILHRVVRRKDDQLYIIGDLQTVVEGPLSADQLVARVIAIWRRSKRFDVLDVRWRFWSLLMCNTITVRKMVKSIYSIFRRIFIKSN